MGRIPIQASTATSVTVDGRELLCFGGNNYLGLAHEPRVHAAVVRGLTTLGLSTTASRETTGNTVLHEELERELAAFFVVEGAILTAEGYTANMALAQSLAKDHRVALIDEKSHRSVGNAVQAAGFEVHAYRHLDASHAAELAARHRGPGVVIWTDGVFAADGSIAPVPKLLAALPPIGGTLVVDDCHGFCVLGPGGRGTAAMFGVRDPRVCITTTLGKGLGCYGGCIAGGSGRVESVRLNSNVYRGSTPAPSPVVLAACAALELVKSEPALIARLRENVKLARRGLASVGITLGPDEVPIMTFTLESPERMEQVHRRLWDAGILAPLIEYPGGPGERFFRLSVNAQHTTEQIERLVRELAAAVGVAKRDLVAAVAS